MVFELTFYDVKGNFRECKQDNKNTPNIAILNNDLVILSLCGPVERDN